MANQYTMDIPSLQANFLHLPPVLGDLNVNVPIVAGQPVDPQHRRNAKSVASLMRIMHSEFSARHHELITDLSFR